MFGQEQLSTIIKTLQKQSPQGGGEEGAGDTK
jgi:hypothetical protein